MKYLFGIFMILVLSVTLFADNKIYDCPFGISGKNPIGELNIDVGKGETKQISVAKGLNLECAGKMDQQFKNGVIVRCGFWFGTDPVTDREKTLIEIQHREPINTGTLSLSIPYDGKRYYVGCDGFEEY
jgi:hypothetical protein